MLVEIIPSRETISHIVNAADGLAYRVNEALKRPQNNDAVVIMEALRKLAFALQEYGPQLVIRNWQDSLRIYDCVRLIERHGSRLCELLGISGTAWLERKTEKVAGRLVPVINAHWFESWRAAVPKNWRERLNETISTELCEAATDLQKQVAAIAPPPGLKAEGVRTAKTKEKPVDKETYAISLLFEEPDLTMTKIAEKVGVSRQNLYTWPKFLEAAEKAGKVKRKKVKGEGLPCGQKVDGRIEAWHEPDKDAE